MEKVLVINLTSMTQHVGVVHSGGSKDSVQIMPKRRVELREGLRVDPAWLGMNPGAVRVIPPQVHAAKPALPVPEVEATEGEEQ